MLFFELELKIEPELEIEVQIKESLQLVFTFPSNYSIFESLTFQFYR